MERSIFTDILENWFMKIRKMRLNWIYSEHQPIADSYFKIFGEDDEYSYLRETIDRKSTELLVEAFIVALKKLDYKYKEFGIECINYDAKSILPCIAVDDKSGLVKIVIFKEFGQFLNQDTQNTIRELIEKNNIKDSFIVSCVKQGAYKEVIGYEECGDDITRKTGIYSYRQVFEVFFGENLYKEFETLSDLYTKKAQDYLGIRNIRSLRPYSIHKWRENSRNELISFDYKRALQRLIQERNLPALDRQQFEYVVENYIDEENYKILVSNSDFSQSFMTSEWLYSTLEGSKHIDLTAISMGYLKSIEQFLYAFIELQTYENTGKHRTLKFSRDNIRELTSALLVDERKRITLDIEIGFLVYGGNSDLYNDFVCESSREFIKSFCLQIKGLRNDYFHKYNINEWDSIIDVRNMTFIFYFLILGSLKINRDDFSKLTNNYYTEMNCLEDDYYRLFKCISIAALKERIIDGTVERAVIDIGDGNFYVPKFDYDVAFNSLGIPQFDKAILWDLENNEIVLTRDNCPNKVWMRTLLIHGRGEIKFTLSESFELIFEKNM
ncbi:MAG: hypothetical protein IJM79_02995 [Erysipelotrichaceae bacterium]|nr:hypothetical protein [Erysipelotrichaceae bacterium]